MLPDLSLGDDELAALGAELGGCDFRSASHRRFLEAAESCDVQAAPGSGKTTALVAKLLVLTRRWRDPLRGVCVVSHTQAARGEVEHRLAAAGAMQMLGYPHYVGTITSFIHRFVAMPYLRGLGWRMSVVDNEVFSVRALHAAREHEVLRNQLWGKKKRQVEGWLRGLTLPESREAKLGARMERVPFAVQDKMPGAHTETFEALERVKASCIAEGVYRYEDMLALARHATVACPAWIAALAARFPVVFVDEAQDTGARQLAALDAIFDGRSHVQKLGDCNQTIYGDDGAPGWQPRADAVDLGESLRFGPAIAAFATRLTGRRPQTISGRAAGGVAPSLIVHADGVYDQVLSAYAELVAEVCVGDELSAWAVGAVHRPGDSESAVSVCDYHRPYRAPGDRERAKCMHAAFRDAVVAAHGGGCLDVAVAGCSRAVVEFLRRQRVPPFDVPARHRDPWRSFERETPAVAGRLRRLIVECVTGQRAASHAGWGETRERLLDALNTLVDPDKLRDVAREFLVEAASDDHAHDSSRTNSLDAPVGHRIIRIRLGSIASVKGETHDATLVLQTTFNRTADVRTALSIASGSKPMPTAKQPQLIRAVTNVFVAATRPRRLLCLALPESDLDAKVCDVVEGWGWRVIRIPGSAPRSDAGPTTPARA